MFGISAYAHTSLPCNFRQSFVVFVLCVAVNGAMSLLVFVPAIWAKEGWTFKADYMIGCLLLIFFDCIAIYVAYTTVRDGYVLVVCD